MKVRSTAGYSLVELVIGAVLSGLLLVSLARMATTSMQASSKGAAHLTNAHAASVLLRGIETDMGRALSVDVGPADISIEVVGSITAGVIGTETIHYFRGADMIGFSRQSSVGHSIVLCQDLLFEGDPVSESPIFSWAIAAKGRRMLRVRFKVCSARNRENPLILERLFLAGNDPAGSAVPGRVK